MTKQSQNQWVVQKLKENGRITRNQCLARYPAITRLSTIIQDLEEIGYVFSSFKDEGDWVYGLIESPKKKVWVAEPVWENGRIVRRVLKETYVATT